MIFKNRIEKHALQKAAELFMQHKLNNTVLQAPEAIAALANEQTTLYLHQHPKLQTKPEARNVYHDAFLFGYNQGVKEQGTTSFTEDVKRALHIPPDDQTQEPE